MEEALNRLRTEVTTKALQEVMDILLRYFPVGTKLEVTKDYWKIIDKE